MIVAAGALVFVPATAHALDLGDLVEDTVDTTDHLVDDTLQEVEDTVGGVEDTVDGLLDDPLPGGGGDPAPPGDPVPPTDPTPNDPTPNDPRPDTDTGSDGPRGGSAQGPRLGRTDEVAAIGSGWVAADASDGADATVVPPGDASDPAEQPAAAEPSPGFVSADGALPALALVALAIGVLVLLHGGVLWLRMQDPGSPEPLAPAGDDPF